MAGVLLSLGIPGVIFDVVTTFGTFPLYTITKAINKRAILFLILSESIFNDIVSSPATIENTCRENSREWYQQHMYSTMVAW